LDWTTQAVGQQHTSPRWRKGGYSLGGVASRSEARSGGIGIDRRMAFSRRRRLLGWRGAGEAWGGPEPVVAPMGLTEGKEGRSSELRTKAWSRVGNRYNNDVVMTALDHRRPGFGRLCGLGQLSGIWLGLWAIASGGAAQSASMFIKKERGALRPGA